MDEEHETGDKKTDGNDGGRTLQAWLAGIGVGCLVMAAMIAAYEIGTNNPSDPAGGKSSAPVAEKPPAKAAAGGPGQDLFVADCGSCHTLAEANTTGAVGPNLDDLQPDAALVTSAIENGGAGSGVMPANIVSGEEVQQIADFVSGSVGTSK
ncbi:MAG: cytochrome c [Solirubrobacterales bacterium]|nr:cytochrome c [Solirubrobacterales bacterium]